MPCYLADCTHNPVIATALILGLFYSCFPDSEKTSYPACCGSEHREMGTMVVLQAIRQTSAHSGIPNVDPAANSSHFAEGYPTTQSVNLIVCPAGYQHWGLWVKRVCENTDHGPRTK
jgi:hypothetical protein